MTGMRAAAVAATLGVGALLAMAATPSAATTAPQIPERPAAITVQTASTEDFLVTIRGLLSARPHVDQSDQDYIDGGKSICADIDNGATWTTFLKQIAEVGGDPSFYRAAITASVTTFCPENYAALYR